MTTDQNSKALGEAVSAMFATLAEQYQPGADLVPTAIARARRGAKRKRVAWGVGGGVVTTVAVAVAVFATTSRSVPTAVAAPSGGPVSRALNAACVGKWLPWTDQSDASLFGKGTDTQRAVVCTEDMATLGSILSGATIAPYSETFGAGSRTDFTPDEVAKLGAGTDPNTPILMPWQYTVTRGGHSGYFYVTYSAKRSDLCTGCGAISAQALPGPPGYRLVGETSASGAPQQPTQEVLIETPRHTYLGVGVSALTGGTFTAPVDVFQLAKDGRFVSTLDRDLIELYGD